VGQLVDPQVPALRRCERPAGELPGGLLRWLAGLAGLAIVACGPSQATPAASGRAATAARYVDSVLPRDQALARFRRDLPEPQELEGGALSPDALVRRFLRALEAADTTALARLALTRAEFAYLYYPYAPESQPPYDLDPGLSWFLLEGRSQKGLRRALQDFGGRPVQAAGWSCQAVRAQGPARIWDGCVVQRVGSAGDTVAESLFGSILEYRGRYKFVSLASHRR